MSSHTMTPIGPKAETQTMASTTNPMKAAALMTGTSGHFTPRRAF